MVCLLEILLIVIQLEMFRDWIILEDLQEIL